MAENVNFRFYVIDCFSEVLTAYRLAVEARMLALVEYPPWWAVGHKHIDIIRQV